MIIAPYFRPLDTAAFTPSKTAAGEARRWLAKVIDRHPCRDDALLLLSEAVTNAAVHTRSTSIEVAVLADGGGELLVKVTDEGSDTIPTAPCHPDDDLTESGRGIRLIRALSSRWGFLEEPPRCTLWFVLSHDPEPGTCPAIPHQTPPPADSAATKTPTPSTPEITAKAG
ncbi:ATP-binding protein [Thermopolyspora sp. NPDC052614]|uniref:ATP-binding protein n=1 Tax=Thermopolyspora sp. NPDC052614 TaxID=3155682 RepID=UPI00343974CB